MFNDFLKEIEYNTYDKYLEEKKIRADVIKEGTIRMYQANTKKWINKQGKEHLFEFSDAELKELKWGDFSHDKENEKWYVNIKRKKTQIPTRLYVNKKAMSFILPEGKPNELVYGYLT